MTAGCEGQFNIEEEENQHNSSMVLLQMKVEALEKAMKEMRQQNASQRTSSFSLKESNF